MSDNENPIEPTTQTEDTDQTSSVEDFNSFQNIQPEAISTFDHLPQNDGMDPEGNQFSADVDRLTQAGFSYEKRILEVVGDIATRVNSMWEKQHYWTPQFGMFVAVEDHQDPMVITQYDARNQMLILSNADTLVRQRDEQFGDTHIRVPVDKVRPYRLPL